MEEFPITSVRRICSDLGISKWEVRTLILSHGIPCRVDGPTRWYVGRRSAARIRDLVVRNERRAVALGASPRKSLKALMGVPGG
jgi:hypothetical protein